MREVFDTVRDCMIEDEECRNDDFKLIKAVIMKRYPELLDFPLGNVLHYHKEYGLPSFETITRARRKVQADCEALRAVEFVEAKRKEMEKEIKDFVK